MAVKPPSDYSEASIRVLKGLEPVKQRPGMYTRTDNPLHVIQEVLDNSADEALAGHGRKIRVTLHQDGSVAVEDDGRGIPHGLHPEENAPVIELVFTRLHAGGKFDKGSGGAYSFSGGLHGVGVSVTNALARRLEATSFRDGMVARLVFEAGDVTEPFTVRPAADGDRKSGTTVRVWPDPKYFESATLPMPVFVVLVTLVVIVVTEFASNVAAAASFIPVVAGVTVALGLDPLVLTLPAAMAASWGFMMPAGTPPNAIAYATGYVTVPQMIRAGIWIDVLGLLVIPAVVAFAVAAFL